MDKVAKIMMIRTAKPKDLKWIVDKSLDTYNELTGEPKTRLELFNILKDSLTGIYVFSDKSAYISTYIFKAGDQRFQLINAWWSSKPGNGLILWKMAEDIARDMNLKQVGMMHKTERKFKRFLIRKGYTFQDAGKFYLVEKQF